MIIPEPSRAERFSFAAVAQMGKALEENTHFG
jgi:hypothetical protein